MQTGSSTHRTRMFGRLLVLTCALCSCDAIRADSPAGDDARPTAVAARLDAADAVRQATSADVLAMLPDGEEKRRFIIDCTNCHVMDSASVLIDGVIRSQAQWEETVARMLGYAGADTDFPVMTPGRSAAATAEWMSRHITHAPRPAAGSRILPEGARIDEFLLPVAEDLPHDVAVLEDGRILVTGMFTHQMWLLDPRDGTWSTERIPVPAANPRAVDLMRGANGVTDWWVLLGNPHLVAHRDGETGEWRTFDIGLYGHSIIPDAAGRVWFNSHFTKDPGVVGYVDARTGTIRTFDIPTPLAATDGGTPIPYGLRIAPDGAAWLTELRGNRIVRVDPETGSVTSYDMPLSVSGPRRPDFDASGSLWIPEYAGGALTRFDPAAETFERHPLPIADAAPYVVRVDRRRDRIWVGTGTADAAFLFDPVTGQFTTYPLPSRGALVRHMDIDDASGEVWLAYGASPGSAARIARIRP